MFSVSPASFAVAREKPNSFQDGFVLARERGFCKVTLLDGGVVKLRIFEAPVDETCFPIGSPVAYHREARVLAGFDLWLSVSELP